MNLYALGSPDQALRMNLAGVSSGQGLGPSASSETASQKIASRPLGIKEISSPPEEIKDLLHVRQDLHFPVTTINKSLFTEIMEPKSEQDLEDHLPWMYLVRDIFQPRPVIVENTKEELERINASGTGEGFSPIREQRYWQNQILLRYAVEEGISKKYYEQDLKLWLEDLHKIASSGLDGSNDYYRYQAPPNGKFSSPSEGIMTRYQKKSSEELEEYLNNFNQFLQLGISSRNRDRQDWLVELAGKYVNITLWPPFKQVNNSTVMNILNLMLKKQGMKEISHGNLDKSFYDYRFRTDERFQKAIGEFPSIFLRAILQTNPKLEKEFDSSLLNIPDNFAEDYKLYLEMLSELDRSAVLKSETYHLMKYLSTGDLVAKSRIFEKIIKFKDLLEKGVHKGVFTDELFTNCLDDISKAFDNLNLSGDLFLRQECLLLESLGLKSRYPDFDTRVLTLEELSSNCKREVKIRKIRNTDRVMHLRPEGLNFLNSKDS
jgi:hypothetical protein